MIKKLWNNERLREIFLYCVVGGLRYADAL